MATLVLVTPCDSIADLASERFPVFPVRWLSRDKYESWRSLVLAAGQDEVIPAWSTQRLLSRFQRGP